MAGYTRNDTANNIADGNIINAADLDGEFDAVQSAFDATTGHTHDGSTGEGAPIEVIGPSQDVIATADSLRPKTDNTIDLGTATLEYKDLFLDGTAKIDTLTVDENATVAGTLGVTGDTTAGNITASGTVTYGSLSDGTITVTAFVDEDDMSSDSATLVPTQQSVKAYVDAQVTAQDLDFQADTGGALNIDLDSETLTIAGGTGIDTAGSGNTVTVNIDSTVATLTGTQTLTNKTLTSPDINGGTVDGATIATSDITVGAGKTLDVSAGTFTLANDQISGDKVEGGTINAITINTLTSTTVNATTVDTTNIEVTNLKAKDGTAAGSIADSTGVVTLASSVLTTTDINGGTIDGVTIGGSSAGAITGTTVTGSSLVSTGNITVSGTVDGRDVATDGTKLDGIEAGADVTDTANVTAAGALMDSELTDIAAVKALDQGVATTDSPTFAGLTTTGDLSFGDNDKAIFGAGSDLQIYHDGSNSKIADVGTGVLELSTNGANVSINSTTENMALFEPNGAVRLYYNNVQKFATTSTGVDVTGTITSDGLTVDGVIDVTSTTSLSTNLQNTGGSALLPTYSFNGSADVGMFAPSTNNLAFATFQIERLRIDSSGNVLRYRPSTTDQYLHLTSTGGTQEIESVKNSLRISVDPTNVDAGSLFMLDIDGSEVMRITSDGSVGIGTISPASQLSVLKNQAADTAIEVSNLGSVGGNTTASFILSEIAGTPRGWFRRYRDGTARVDVGYQGNVTFSSNIDTTPVERMRIDSNGSVGIGTSSPATKFHASTTSANGEFRFESSHPSGIPNLQLKGAGSATLRYLDENDNIQSRIDFRDGGKFDFVNNSGNSHMLIDSNGSVGIGTSSPSTRLEIASGNAGGDAGLDAPVLRITNTTPSGDWDSGDVNGTIEFYTTDESGSAPYDTAFISSVVDINNGVLPSGALVFGTATYNAVGGAVERMRIDSSGRVGIGTTSPSQKLEVSGGNAQIYGTADGAWLFIKSPDATSGMNIGFNSVEDANIFVAENKPLLFGTNNTERMRIDSSGNVGIGTSSPSNALHVNSGAINQAALFESSDATVQVAFADNSTATYFPAVGATGQELFLKGGGSASRHMTIDSDGNVGIGTDSPSQKLHLVDSDPKIQLTRTSDFYYGQLSAEGFAAFTNTNGSAPVIFKTASTERMRIDSSGNLLVGKTDTTAGVAGGEIRSTGLLKATVNGSDVAIFRRLTSDGDIIKFQKDGTPVGSIGASGGQAYIGSSDTGILFISSADAITPHNTSTNAARSASIDIGTSSRTFKDLYLSGSIHGDVKFENNAGTTEYARFDSSGNLLVGTTDNVPGNGDTNTGVAIGGAGYIAASTSSTNALNVNRNSTDGDLAVFRKDGATVGSIGVKDLGGGLGARMYIGNTDTGLYFQGQTNNAITPCQGDSGATQDNLLDLGSSTARFDDIYATNGTIQTSDRNEKQDINVLSDAETRVAVAAKGLLRKFRWKDAVAEKGDDARIHFGIIAQDLQAAFEAEGLDAGRYAMFIHSTWTDEETGEEKSRMGVRYSELLAFIIAAI